MSSQPERSQKYGLCSIATLPLISKGKAIGVLNIASMRRYLISDEEKETLISISRELGSAIERLCTEEERRRSAQNIRTMFQSIEDIVFVVDLKGTIIAMNAAAEQKLSYSRQELIGRNILDILAPEKREEALILYEKLVNGTGRTIHPNYCKRWTRIESIQKFKGKWVTRMSYR
jgi:PAS domain S-box-containing protein